MRTLQPCKQIFTEQCLTLHDSIEIDYTSYKYESSFTKQFGEAE